MRKRTFTSGASALLLLTASLVSAKHGVHDHLEVLHKRHRAHRELTARSTAEEGELGVEIRAIPETSASHILEKRNGQCAFPTDAGLVSVTPGDENAGWAMSPDQPCTPGNYCPYACPPGQVSMQWDPSATSYSYPKSMNGGLYCDNDGNIQKPFPDKPYCQSTATNIGVVNNAGGVVSFCQTVLPGNEAMLIPTSVDGFATLAVPDPTYWCGTAAHYYINPPGIGTDEACVWGTNANPLGNWSPYVAGANADSSGETFIKLGWNPIYLEPTTPFRNEMPDWGVKIDCPNGGCNGLPCAIDPSQNKVNQMVGSSSDGAGGGAFCVVTVAKGSSANFVIFKAGGDSSSGGSSSSSASGSQGGQFFQSTTSSEAAPPPTSSESSSSDTWTSSAEPTSSAWTSSSVTTTSSSPSSSSVAPTTTKNSSRLPTHSPYYSLFNHTSTAGATEGTEGASETAAGESPAAPSESGSSVQPSISPATGAAPMVKYSIMSIFLGLTFFALATL
ncbi:uncharacterized protein Z518_07093 [Rhinocladiella mackenziei CBS 650.93]|uniref:Rhinocladiella mackenziei CBS 650.93 unplaced genomic scaffold supercont1.5, whole genome shotgun sequence n=1 Tax=Rhinocladiella mackenziei CBS 650.93 TaxID=1442369 RepID=A0A0D2J3L6_9EURO|nr:uncharacterized protein Z518_07093 [Rhinocladiella mackenziei CBS 650.93]KIX03540.1 hypothetical protein Z518_07093 [Rhinocladiella mackenziei CBS 650.93]